MVALPATSSADLQADFSAFMSVWFFEEQKHSLVLIEYLRRFRPETPADRSGLHAVRFQFESGAAARDAHAAFLWRDPAESLVPAAASHGTPNR